MRKSASKAATLLLCLCAVARADLMTGLVAYYPFDGNAEDQSGNGNHGTVYGAALTTDRFGNTSSAYDFEKSERDYIEVDDNPTLNPETAVSISSWVMFESYPTSSESWATVVNKWRSYVQQFHWSSGLTMTVFNGTLGEPNVWTGFWRDTSPASDLELDQWYHIVSTYEDVTDEGHVYINGVDLPVVARPEGWPDELQVSSDKLRLGGYAMAGYDLPQWQWFDGKIDDIRIYDRVLSSSEVQQLHTGQPVPEPSAAALFALGLGTMLSRRRRRRP